MRREMGDEIALCTFLDAGGFRHVGDGGREQTCKRIWEELSDKGLDELSQLIQQRHEVLGRNEY